MKAFKKCIVIVVFVLLIFPQGVSTETVVFTDGKILEVKYIQEQGNKVSFLFQGVKISVDKVDIERIEAPIEPPVKRKQNPPEKVKSKESVFPPDGFRALRWGDSLYKVTDFQALETENSMQEVEEYVRSKEALKIGLASAESIVYGFWENRLYAVTIWTRAYSNYLALRRYVVHQLGPGLKIDKDRERYIWSGNKTDWMLGYTKSSKYGMLFVRSREIDKQFKIAKSEPPTSYLEQMEFLKK